MVQVLVATAGGCRVFEESGSSTTELEGRAVICLAPDADGGALALLDGHQIWRRTRGGDWSLALVSGIGLASILSLDGWIFGGGMSEGALIRGTPGGEPERMVGFDDTPGRSSWFPQGPPVHVRSLAVSCDSRVLMAAVHVGGIPRSEDGGVTWKPSLPIEQDVHEVRTHPTDSSFAAAASGLGLCVSRDAGLTWEVIVEGLDLKDSLAVAVLQDEVLFSIQESPFASASQLWRWRLAGACEQVRDGLPEWLSGKLDTGHVAAAHGRAALVDGGGNVWLSSRGSRGWTCLATGLTHAFGILLI